MIRLMRQVALAMLLATTGFAVGGNGLAQSSGGSSTGGTSGGMSGGMSGGSSASTGAGVSTPSSSHPEISPAQSPSNDLTGSKGIKPVDQASTVDKHLEKSNDATVNSICGTACGVNQQPATP